MRRRTGPMWRKFRASGLAVRLALFVLFLAAMAFLNDILADRWRAGEERARALTGAPAGSADAAARHPEP